MVSQKDAVFNAIAATLGSSKFTDPVDLTPEQRKAVVTAVLAGLKNGDIAYNGDTTDSSKLSSYASGLVSNWLRKDKRLNGNTSYSPKNPGSRVGANDDSLKAMRTLIASVDDEEAKKEIQAEIDRRVAALKPKKTINVDALPEQLRHLVEAELNKPTA